MKITITLDTATKEGQNAYDYIKKLKAPEKSIAIKKERRKKIRKLTDEEMALPGPPPSPEELEAWLAEPDEDEALTLDEARQYLMESLTKYTKQKKKKS